MIQSKIANHPHRTLLVRGGFQKLQAYLPEECIALVDERVDAIYGDAVRRQLGDPVVLPSGEKAKRLAVAERCWMELQQRGAHSETTLVSVGGGSTCDLTGFVAACYMRGVAVIHVPTSLLAMVDAAIGGKTAVNLGNVKNAVGALHQPDVVLIDPELLTSLSKREFCGGLAEIIKCAAIADESLFKDLEQNLEQMEKATVLDEMISRTAALKCRIVSEGKERDLLNYGHTFGHALEVALDYTIPHGEAVSIGMSCAANSALELGLVSTDFVERQDQLLQRAQLPIAWPTGIDRDQAMELMLKDKKARNGELALVLPTGIGQGRMVRGVTPRFEEKRRVANG